jgi:hypothetical protein
MVAFMIVAALLVAVLQVSAATAPPRTLHYPGHTVVIDSREGAERVRVWDRNGDLESESYCDRQSGTYDQIVALGRALMRAAKQNDHRGLIALMQYPLRVNFGSKHTVWIRSQRELIAHFDTIVTPTIIAALRDDEPLGVFCREGMSMVNGGDMWATTDAHGVLKVAVINH